MGTIKIIVRSKKHARMLTELARELNFVASVESSDDERSSAIPVGKFLPKKTSCPCVACGKTGILPLKKSESRHGGIGDMFITATTMHFDIELYTLNEKGLSFHT